MSKPARSGLPLALVVVAAIAALTTLVLTGHQDVAVAAVWLLLGVGVALFLLLGML